MMQEEIDVLERNQLVYLQLLLDNGCKFLFRTVIFGKTYVWMQDKFGQIFLERIPEHDSQA